MDLIKIYLNLVVNILTMMKEIMIKRAIFHVIHFVFDDLSRIVLVLKKT